MKSERPITEAKKAKIAAMAKLKAAYVQAKAQGQVKSYRVTPISND